MNGLIEWFADNPIAANLLMLIILAGGFSGLESINKEMFPTVKQDKVRVTVAYPGAGPREVEKQICLRIEDSLDDLEGIEETRCVARLGSATAEIEAASGYPLSRLLNAVKSRVDSINTLPQESERPVIEELPTRQRVVSLAVSSSGASERDLKEYTEQIKEELSALPEVPLVKILGTRNYEISVEIAETTLRKYGLTFTGVADAIRRHSLD
ncbi:MAG: efflux RND transporter permease subunit, partial [Gammaproteobacteria bacterium]|nr:efflux RND transporter permease subunit [Gammaproteobacteria bacterium]